MANLRLFFYCLLDDLECELRALEDVALLPELLLALVYNSSVFLLVDVNDLCLDSLQIPVILVLLAELLTECDVTAWALDGLELNCAESDRYVLWHAAAACTELDLRPDCFLLTETSDLGFRA